MTDVDDFVKAEPARDRYGRYLIKPPKGGKAKAYTRATTIAETLDDRFNLEQWKVRMTALGLVQRPDLYASIASLPTDDKAKLNTLCDQAREAAAGSAGANLGTALHRFTERINRGEDVKVPAPWDADITAYKEALDRKWLIEEDFLERIVVHHELGIAGTFDCLLTTWPASSQTELTTYIADLKTGATLDFSWGAIAVQLAIYAHADTLYDPATETHEPMPAVDQDTAIVIHLPAGKATCTLYEVDIAAGWEAAQHALWARGWRKRKDLAKPCNAQPETKTSSLSSVPSETPSTASATTPGTSRTNSLNATLRANPISPSPPTINEGGDADPKAIAALKKRHDKLTDEQRSWISKVISPEHHGDRRISLVNHPTQRRYEIGRALVRFAELGVDDDTFRAALGIALNEELQPAITTGAAVGALTLEEAVTLSGIAIAIKEGARLVNGALVYAA